MGQVLGRRKVPRLLRSKVGTSGYLHRRRHRHQIHEGLHLRGLFTRTMLRLDRVVTPGGRVYL